MNSLAYEAKKAWLPAAVLGLLTLAGCSDVLTAPEPLEAERGARQIEAGEGMSRAERIERFRRVSTKARHLHLLDRAMVGGEAGKMTSGSDGVRLIVGLSNASATIDSVLSRIIKRYKILNRFEYRTALSGIAVTVPVAKLDSFALDLENTSSVDWMEPDPAVPLGTSTTSNEAGSGQTIPWGITSVGADASWAVSGNGEGSVDVDLYVIDTGSNHADLNVVECIEFSNGGGSAMPCTSTDDPDGHGTAVAGAAAALDNEAGIVGVAPGARVHAVKVTGEGGNTAIGSLLAVVDFLTARKLADPSKPMVVNISLGADVKTSAYNGLDEAIRSSIAAGVVYVIAAGNDGIDASTVTPAHVAEAITVAAHDEAWQLASFSNHGALIDLVAPGQDVLTLSGTSQVGTSSGTSVAAPHVAGAAALLLAQNPTLTPSAVRAALLANARANVTGVPGGTTNLSLYVK